MRRAARVDTNHVNMVEAFRSLGCSVLSLAALGKGVPDLLVATKGITWLIEVKMPKGKQTADQIKFAKQWRGKQTIVRDVAGVQEVVTLMNNKPKDKICLPKILLNY